MKKSILRQIFSIEYVLTSFLVMLLVYLMVVISGLLPEADETSFLNPIFDRIDFLNIDDVSLDAIFAMKPANFPDQRIVVINVGEVAPTPDGKIAAAVLKVNEYGAKAVGVDVIFDALHFERFGEDRAWEKQALTNAFAQTPNIVVVNGYDNETLSPAFQLDPAIKANVEHFGFASLEKDEDGVVRRFWPYRTIEGERWLSFPVSVLTVYDSVLVVPLLRLPEEPQIIYYTATHNQFKGQTLPIDDVINHPAALAPFYKKIFDGAIVLIGFVNEGGLWYPDDTHKTPMGKKISITQRDGSSRMGMEGPDMSGILIHANVITMMLSKNFIQPVPVWLDWLLVFFLAYMSIALYRVLRAKPNSRFGIGVLITSFLAIESLIVFFLPIIAFFNMDVKISYNLMATCVLLFIPANAMVNNAQIRGKYVWKRRLGRNVPYPPALVLADVYQDDESFPLYVRMIHSALYHLHFVYAVELMKNDVERKSPLAVPSYPALKDWEKHIDAVGAILHSTNRRSRMHAHFYRYLEGMKDVFLRDSFTKNFFFQTEFSHFNPHHYFEQWEILEPHILRMFKKDINAYQSWRAVYLGADGDVKHLPDRKGTSAVFPAVQFPAVSSTGVYVYNEHNQTQLFDASPLLIYAECKLHRRKELFVFAAAVPQQYLQDNLVVYYGETISCEAIIPQQHLLKLKSTITNGIESSYERS